MSQLTYRGKTIEEPARNGNYIEMYDSWMWCDRCNDRTSDRECMEAMTNGCTYINVSALRGGDQPTGQESRLPSRSGSNEPQLGRLGNSPWFDSTDPHNAAVMRAWTLAVISDDEAKQRLNYWDQPAIEPAPAGRRYVANLNDPQPLPPGRV